MINKINTKKNIYNLLFFLTILGINIFLGAQFPYIFSGNYFKRFNQKNLSKDIVIVGIDENTLNAGGISGVDVSRDDYARTIKNISDLNPKVIGVDIFFNQAQPGKDDKLKAVLNYYDNVLIANEYNEDCDMGDDRHKGCLELLFMGQQYKEFGYVNMIGKKPILYLSTESIRNAIPVYPYENGGNPFRLKLYEKIFNIQNIQDGEGYRMLDDKKIPIQDDSFNINFFGNINNYRNNKCIDDNNNWIYQSGCQYIRFVDMYDNINDKYDFKKLIDGKIVLIGAIAHDKHDEFYTPYGINDLMPGVVVHANMLNSALSSKFLYYQNLWFYVLTNGLAILLFIFVKSIIKNNLVGSLATLGVFLLYGVFSIFGFVLFGWFIEVFPLFVSYFFVMLILYLKNYLEERKSKDEIKKVFGKYVSQNVVDEIIKTGVENLRLGGNKKEITVFFSDLAGFTNISEELDPEKLGKVLNIYLETMTNIILDHKGTIDKYIGDAIMCFWNAPFDNPNHQQLACETAILQRKAMNIVRQRIKALEIYGNFDMRIGINTGSAIIGNFGSSTRHDYTALGDTVNLASRLESLCKYYGINVLISENTYKTLDKEKFLIREIDRITVKGKHLPVSIYELIGFREDGDDFMQHKLAAYEKALYLYRQGHFEWSKKMFSEIGDGPSRIFMARCENYMRHPPVNWDGIYKFDIK